MHVIERQIADLEKSIKRDQNKLVQLKVLEKKTLKKYDEYRQSFIGKCFIRNYEHQNAFCLYRITALSQDPFCVEAVIIDHKDEYSIVMGYDKNIQVININGAFIGMETKSVDREISLEEYEETKNRMLENISQTLKEL